MIVTNFGFAVMLISSISCLAVGLWMLFIMKHDQRNPKSAGIAMLLMSLGLGLMAVHTYTTNLLSHGAAPKDVQELLGHSDVSTTMNIYAHATREAKRTSARLLDKVVGTA